MLYFITLTSLILVPKIKLVRVIKYNNCLLYTSDDFEKAGIMSMNGKETMGLGMDVKVDWNGKIKPAALPYLSLIHILKAATGSFVPTYSRYG